MKPTVTRQPPTRHPLEVGQVWIPCKPGCRAKARTIVWRNNVWVWGAAISIGWVHDPLNPEFRKAKGVGGIPGKHDSYLTEKHFWRWIETSGARLLTDIEREKATGVSEDQIDAAIKLLQRAGWKVRPPGSCT